MAEWALPLAALPRALEEIDAVIKEKGFKAHFPVEVCVGVYGE